MRRYALVAVALIFGCTLSTSAVRASPRPASLPSLADPAVQSAIAAAVQRDRVRYGGKTRRTRPR